MENEFIREARFKLRLTQEELANQLGCTKQTAVDLYCGTGNLSLPLTRRFKQVIGIEGLPDLVKGAISNAAGNNIDNVEFSVADLSRGVGLASIGQAEDIDLIVLDPQSAFQLRQCKW